MACTTPATSTTPAASPWSRGWTTSPTTASSTARSRRWTTSSTAAPRAPTSAPATARASSSRSRTRSSARASTSSCRRAGAYGVAVCFLPRDPQRRRKLEELIELNVRIEGQQLLGWRDVPVDLDHVGDTANASRPHVKQLFIGAGAGFTEDQDRFERKLYVIRRIVELAAGPDFYAPSFSSRTCVYKGMLISHQLRDFYPDLKDERFGSALALVHSRFSTNTFPQLGPRAPVPRDRPQRRDQHADGQRQLDARARVAAGLRAVRPRPPEGHADRAPRRVGLRDVRQRPRAADARRPLAAARGDDDDPRGLRRPRRPPGSPQGLLRLPLLPDGAVGRAGVGLLHRRHRRRRDAGPQRAASRPLGRDQGRLRHARLRDRHAAGRAR